MNRRKKETQEIVLYPSDKTGENDVTDPRHYSCCNMSKMCTRWTVGILSLVSALVIMPVAIVAYVSTSNTLAIQRYSLVSPDGCLTGMLQLDTGSRSISWNVYLFLNCSITDFSLVSFGIYGPITNNYGVEFVPLCGPPTSQVCTVNGTALQLNPQGYSLVPYITQIRAFPMWYYVNVSDVSVSISAPLGISAGSE